MGEVPRTNRQMMGLAADCGEQWQLATLNAGAVSLLGATAFSRSLTSGTNLDSTIQGAERQSAYFS